mgnify:CR=1 FL=1
MAQVDSVSYCFKPVTSEYIIAINLQQLNPCKLLQLTLLLYRITKACYQYK